MFFNDVVALVQLKQLPQVVRVQAADDEFRRFDGRHTTSNVVIMAGADRGTSESSIMVLVGALLKRSSTKITM